MSIESSFASKRPEADNIQQKNTTDADYADDLALLANTPAQI